MALFIAGLALGLVIGGSLGIVLVALMAASRREDDSRMRTEEYVRELRKRGFELVDKSERPDIAADVTTEMIDVVKKVGEQA